MTHDIRVLSVRQPWASLIAAGEKTIELRSWSTRYRGSVLIVAGVGKWKGETKYSCGPRGVAICLVDLVDVRPVLPSDAGRACLPPPAGFDFAWCLKNPRPVPHVRVLGKLGLYRADAELLAGVGLG